MRTTAFLLYVASAAVAIAAAARIPRLANGINATIEEFPYQVSLQYLFGYGDHRRHFCGGAILDKSHVITAAHCIKNEPAEWVVAAAGVTNVRDYNSSRRVELPVSRVHVHPLYSGGDPHHDVAVIQVSGEFPLDSLWMSAVPLQTEALSAGAACSVTGWGYLGKDIVFKSYTPPEPITSGVGPVDNNTSRLPQPSVNQHTTTGLKDLADNLQAATVTLGTPSQCENGTCLITAHGSDAPCEGDDGGPLVCSGRLTGIAQRTANCSFATNFLFTDVMAHAQWINTALPLNSTALLHNSTLSIFD